MEVAAILLRSLDRGVQSRQAPVPSVENRRDVLLNNNEIDETRFGQDVPYNHRGTVVVASVWLALYVIAVIYQLMAPAN